MRRMLPSHGGTFPHSFRRGGREGTPSEWLPLLSKQYFILSTLYQSQHTFPSCKLSMLDAASSSYGHFMLFFTGAVTNAQQRVSTHLYPSPGHSYTRPQETPCLFIVTHTYCTPVLHRATVTHTVSSPSQDANCHSNLETFFLSTLTS